MAEYKPINQKDNYSYDQLLEKYEEAVEDIQYLEWRLKELGSDYDGLMGSYFELWDQLIVYQTRYGEPIDGESTSSCD